MGISAHKYDEIMRDYEMRRTDHLMDVSIKKESLYKAIPRLRQIDDSISDLQLQKFKASINPSMYSTEDIKNKISVLIKEKNSLIQSAGYAEDYLEPNFDCSDCKDTGYIDGQKCHCLKDRIRTLLYDQSKIHTMLEKENFTSYTDIYYNDTEKASMAKIVSIAKNFIATFDNEFKNLLLYGGVGSGKTFISNCIASEIIKSEHSVLYFTSYQLFDLIAKRTFSKNQNEDYDFSLDDILDCDLLVIDDLGTELTNSFTASQLFLILNERLARRKSVIISTNLSMKQLNDLYSERSVSRLFGNYSFCQFTNRDMRMEMKGLK